MGPKKKAVYSCDNKVAQVKDSHLYSLKWMTAGGSPLPWGAGMDCKYLIHMPSSPDLLPEIILATGLHSREQTTEDSLY